MNFKKRNMLLTVGVLQTLSPHTIAQTISNQSVVSMPLVVMLDNQIASALNVSNEDQKIDKILPSFYVAELGNSDNHNTSSTFKGDNTSAINEFTKVAFADTTAVALETQTLNERQDTHSEDVRKLPINQIENEIAALDKEKVTTKAEVALANTAGTKEVAIADNPKTSTKQEVATLDPSNMVFNTSFLRQGVNGNVSLEDLLTSGVLPGSYEVLIIRNGRPTLNQEIEFRKNNRNNLVEACISIELLDKLGVDTQKIMAEGRITPDTPLDCLDLPMIMDKAAQEYDGERFRLMISIPQVYLKQDSAIVTTPDLWDYGINTFSSQYSASVNQSWNHDNNTTNNNASASFRHRLNLFNWRVHNTGALTYSTQTSPKYSSFTFYAERDIDYLKAQLRVGEVYASAHGLDGVGIRGVQITDDLSMQPTVVRNIRQSVRGQAETSATVEIRQRGFLIYTTNVPPGPFELFDIPNVASDGDLEVTVIEADGRKLITLQPWVSGIDIVAPGFFTYQATAGRYNNYGSSNGRSLNVASLDYTYGLSSYLTLTGGSQVADGYLANSLSFVTRSPIGPVSIDVSHSMSNAGESSSNGGGIGFSYNKFFDAYGLSVGFASQRFTSKGFRSLSTHAMYRSNPEAEEGMGKIKLNTSIYLNKRMDDPRWGTFYSSLSESRYWDKSGRLSSFTIGYNNTFKQISYSVNGSYTKNLSQLGQDTRDTKQLMFTVSIPLGGDDNPINLSSSYSTTSGFSSSQSISKRGSFDIDGQQFNYGAYVNGSYDRISSVGTNVSASTPHASYFSSLTTSSHFTSLNLGASGGVVVHQGGINFAKNVTGSFALVQIPGQSGVQISGNETGYNGYAVSPLAPYQFNQIMVGKNLDASIDLVQDVGIVVVPRRDAVVAANFDIVTGRRVEFTIKQTDGNRVPFGAIITDAEGNRLGVTDPFGKALVLIKEPTGTLSVLWDNQECTFNYELGEKDPDLNFEKLSILCAPKIKEQP